jgi:hypothetical protein
MNEYEKEHEFTLILEGPLDMSDEALDRLFESGCDDGTPVTVDDTSFIVFHREAPSLEEAIRSAIETVRSAGYEVARVTTDETEIVDRVNRQLPTA